MSTNNQRLMAELRGIQLQIETVDTEGTTITDQQRSRAETGAFVESYFENLQLLADNAIDRELSNIASGDRPNFFSITTHAAQTGQITVDLSPALAAALTGDVLKGRILSRLRVIPEGLDAEPRAERLREIERELWVLGVREERLILQLEAAGVDVCRRPDVDPRIVLGLDEDLDRSIDASIEQDEDVELAA